MRGLAEYAMHGRRQAILVVLLCGFFPLLYFISAAVVGLVNLRKTRSEGYIILLWSLLPAGVQWIMGDSSPLILMISVTILAQVLKEKESWALVIMLATGMALAIQLSLILQTGYVEQITRLVEEALVAQQSQGGQADFSSEQLVGLMLGFYGAYHMAVMILCLMLARWWQAALYNPGGFRQEFHNLRFEPKFMAVLTALIVGGLIPIAPLNSWLAMFCIPPIISGLAVVHYYVGRKNLSWFWLALAYMTTVMASPMVILLGLLDSVLDFRKRISEPNQ